MLSAEGHRQLVEHRQHRPITYIATEVSFHNSATLRWIDCYRRLDAHHRKPTIRFCRHHQRHELMQLATNAHLKAFRKLWATLRYPPAIPLQAR